VQSGLKLIGHAVSSVSFGDETNFKDGRLVVSAPEASKLFAAPSLGSVNLAWTSPGDSSRIVKVLDAVQPRAKSSGGSGRMFPGFLGPQEGEATGETHVLEGVAVVVAGFLPRAQESLVDMSGPASELSPLAKTHNLVVEFEPAEGASWEEVESALRLGVLKLAVHMAEAASTATPDSVRDLSVIETAGSHPIAKSGSNGGDPRGRQAGLPRVGLVTNLQTQGAFKDVFVYGQSLAKSMPVLIDPGELEDGAVVSGQYGHPGLKNFTYLYQNHPLVAEMRRRDGKDLQFAGLILSPEPVEQERKEAASKHAAEMCADLGLDAMIVTKEGGGNADSDMALKMDAVEEMGIHAVGIFAEMSGPAGDGPPVVGPPRQATAMISTGNYDERLQLPAVEKAYGGDRLEVAGAKAIDALEIPTAIVYGSLNPLGWGRLTAAPAEKATAGDVAGPTQDRTPRSAKVAHYINQFFAGLGGEEKADTGPGRLNDLAPISRKLNSSMPENLEVTATIYCGDDYAASNPKAPAEILGLIQESGAEVVVAGPAFGSGRYGIACARVATAANEAGLTAVCAMDAENPGVGELKPGGATGLASGSAARLMGAALEKMANAAGKLVAGESVGEADGLIEKPSRRNVLSDHNAARRAVDLALARIAGDKQATEIPLADFGVVTPAAPVADAADAVFALLTEGGLVPTGNPGRLESARATKWLRYPAGAGNGIQPGESQSVHGGFSTAAANADPQRILPLEAARQLESEGKIGRLFDEYFVTVGNGTGVADAARFGVEWAAELHKAGVQAAILTST